MYAQRVGVKMTVSVVKYMSSERLWNLSQPAAVIHQWWLSVYFLQCATQSHEYHYARLTWYI